MKIQKLNIHDSNSSDAVAPSVSDIQALENAAIAAFAAYNKHWDAALAEIKAGEAANLPKIKADIVAGEAALSRFIAECNNANVKLIGGNS